MAVTVAILRLHELRHEWRRGGGKGCPIWIFISQLTWTSSVAVLLAVGNVLSRMIRSSFDHRRQHVANGNISFLESKRAIVPVIMIRKWKDHPDSSGTENGEVIIREASACTWSARYVSNASAVTRLFDRLRSSFRPTIVCEHIVLCENTFDSADTADHRNPAHLVDVLPWKPSPD